MKNIIKQTVIYAISIIFLISCDKEVKFINSFDFKISENHNKIGTVNLPIETNLIIAPERIVNTTKYYFKYIVEEGSGFYELSNKEKIIPNQWTETKSLDFALFFKGNLAGNVKIKFFIKDNFEREKIISLNYLIEQNSFDFSIKTTKTTVTIDQPTTYNLVLLNNGVDNTVTYKVKSFISKGNGKIEQLKENGEIDFIVNPNINYDIKTGLISFNLTLTNDGISIITVEIEDSNGQLIRKNVEFAVNVINFNYTAELERNNTIIGSDIKINFNIEETDGGNDTYVSRFVLVEGNGKILSNDIELFAGQNNNVSIGAYSWVFRSTEIGKITLNFVTTNTSGVEKNKTLTFEVLDNNFDFVATRDKAEAKVKEKVKVTFNITEDVGAGDNYEMFYTSSSNGTFEYDGVVYSAGQVFDLNNLSFIGFYSGEIKNKHDVAFTITSKSNNKSKIQKITINIVPIDFSMSITETNQAINPRPEGILQGDVINLNHVITEVGGTGTYKISFNISGTTNKILNLNGVELIQNVPYDVNENVFNWNLETKNVGTTDINYFLDDGLGTIFEISKSITIKNIPFDFKVTPNDDNFQTDKIERFNVDMNAPSSLTYNLIIQSSSIISKIIYNGNDYKLGDKIAVTNENFHIEVVSKSPGLNNLKFLLVGSNGVTKEKSTAGFFLKTIVLNRAIATVGGSFGRTYSFKVFFTKGSNDRITNVYFVRRGTTYTFNSATTKISDNEFSFSKDFLSEEPYFFLNENVEIYVKSSNGTISNSIKGVVNLDKSI